MKKLKLREQAMIHSSFALIYIILISFLMTNGEKIFGNDNNILGPIGVLLLLVLSASVMGMLMFGKPIMLFLDGNKKDAVKLAIYNIVSLFVITVIYFGFMIIIK